MSKNKSSRAEKILRRERARRRAKIKKALIICGFVLVAAALIVLAIVFDVAGLMGDGGVGHVHGAGCNH